MDLLPLFWVGGESIRNPVSREGRPLGQRVGPAVSSEANGIVKFLHRRLFTILP
jgi:hypothetical protein